ncbi:PAS domain-containing protein [Microvirga tunisiensis]|uniref:histidine kinase n=1 Tax=Microvirga tunisiensis TaxID=2108360 RepID=A0A5N7MPG7_9HYPH|nr:PAS domain-containing protein [Microvirga tunisiensis]MPR10739.1 PAS domain S-box protein [Microvirga tunisiensis]MPR28911.1 PAS domain S-box protein [Microvirga tunisiensis]
MASTAGSDPPVRGVDDVLITAELASRPSRTPNYETESRALGLLAQEMAANPGGVLQKCAELVMELCRADSAGISILEPGGTSGMLRWHAAACGFAVNLHGTMPREASPCGTVMERNCVLLFNEAERFFPALRGVEPRIYENLLAPWHVKGEALGTLWAIRHTPEGRFDAEDARVLQSLARFAAAAFQMTSALDEAKADRTELEQRTKALHASETRLQAAIDLVGLSPYTWDPATGALGWDARLKAMWGLPPDAHVDEELFLSGIHPEDRPRVEAAIAQCSDPAGPSIYAIEYRVIGLEDGVERWVSTHGRTTFEDGQPVGFTGAALDITERKRAEAALRESEARFRQFAENSSTVLWILNLATMNLEYLSPAFEPVWGETIESTLGGPSRWGRFVHPEDRERARGALDLVRLGEAITEEFRIVRSDGAVRWIRNTIFPIRDERDQIRCAGGVAQDITRHEGRFVYVVDADEPSRQDLTRGLRNAGYDVRAFPSGKAFLEAAPALVLGCVVLDIRQPDAGGLTIPRELKTRRIGLPVIVLGEIQSDVKSAVQVMKAGAVDFLPIPYNPDELLTAVASAAADISQADKQDQEANRARGRIAEMSVREREVLAGLLAGQTNKQIGRGIGLSPRTVETHRAHVMQRLGARTIPELVRIAALAGVHARG